MTKTLLTNDILTAYTQMVVTMNKPQMGNSSPSTPTNYNPCVYCGAIFATTKALAKHEVSHTQTKRKHECKECGKKFNSSSDLKRHSLIHTNTRPYKCHLCPTAFVQQAHLTRHLKSHTRHGVRFKCLGCGTMFLHSTNVRWHQQYCKEAQGPNTGYVVTQSQGEGHDTVPVATKRKRSNVNDKTLYKEEQIDTRNSMFKWSQHSSESSDTESGSSTNSDQVNKNVTNDRFRITSLLDNAKQVTEPQLSVNQLSYLKSRVSMVTPKTLQNVANNEPNVPTTEADLSKLLLDLQKRQISEVSASMSSLDSNKSTSLRCSSSPNLQLNSTRGTSASPHLTVTSPQMNVTSPRISCPSPDAPKYKIVQNKIIQNNMPCNQAKKSVLELVRTLIAGGLQGQTIDVVIKTLSQYLTQPLLSDLNPFKKRKLDVFGNTLPGAISGNDLMYPSPLLTAPKPSLHPAFTTSNKALFSSSMFPLTRDVGCTPHSSTPTPITSTFPVATSVPTSTNTAFKHNFASLKVIGAEGVKTNSKCVAEPKALGVTRFPSNICNVENDSRRAPSMSIDQEAARKGERIDKTTSESHISKFLGI